MGLLSKAQILESADRPTEDVAVPEWGGDVRVRVLSGTERDQYEQRMHAAGKGGAVIKNVRALLVQMAAVDGEGAPLFAEADILALGQKSAAALDRVFAAAQKLNKLGVRDVEDAEKNSGKTGGDGSSSTSPASGESPSPKPSSASTPPS